MDISKPVGNLWGIFVVVKQQPSLKSEKHFMQELCTRFKNLEVENLSKISLESLNVLDDARQKLEK